MTTPVLSLEGAPEPFTPGELTIVPPLVPPIGRQVVYLGFPFGSASLVVSSGYVSSVDLEFGVRRLRIDGSVNRGNSGGPLFDAESGLLLGIVTRAEVGLILKQFAELKASVANNIQVLQQAQGIISLGAVNPIDATRATMVVIGVLAEQLERSANVGIGFAFSTDRLAAVLSA